MLTVDLDDSDGAALRVLLKQAIAADPFRCRPGHAAARYHGEVTINANAV